MYNPFSLEGKTILVTGASSGIGRAAAIECSKMGATVIITARDETRLAETMSMMEGEGHMSVICDLSIPEEVERLASSVPHLNGLVNNAGFTKTSPIPFYKSTDFDVIFSVNTIAPVMLLKWLIKMKKLHTGASVVFTSSIAGIGRTCVANGLYSCTKGAISAFIPVAALELASKHIRVNAVCPGMVDTNILSSGIVAQDQLDADRLNYPLGRYGRPEDIAWAMIYLLSDASAWVTGTNMVIDGGVSLK